MKNINEVSSVNNTLPIKAVQFGEGNFLRAFADYMIDVANEKGVFNGSVAIVKCVKFGSLERFKKQNNLYTSVLRGKLDGEVINTSRIITSIFKAVGCYENFEEYISLAHIESLRFIISNTTEAGIVLDRNDTINGIPETYPAKLTQFLFERYNAFEGDPSKGLIILPVELIEDNGVKLKEYVLELSDIWNLPKEFINWINTACVFCSTLVDRIVTGYPADEAESLWENWGYKDELIAVAEPFGLWVIESEKDISEELPLHKIGMPVIFTDNQKPYKERKVRILNGAHTSSVLLGWLTGLEIVRECMEDKTLRQFMEKAVNEEIKPFVKLPENEVTAFADAVFERFENPFIRHRVLDISLNSVSKWRARVLPSFKDYYNKNGEIPKALTMSFAALLAFYTSSDFDGNVLKAARLDGTEYTVNDSENVLKFFAEYSAKDITEFVLKVAENTEFWGEDLSLYKGFTDTVCKYLNELRKNPKSAVQKLLNGEI